MENVLAAESFSAMGSESRLDVLKVLVRAGNQGLPVGEIGERTGIPASTLNHHLKFLSAAGLIDQAKNGRTITNTANFDHLTALAEFILSECCIEEKDDG
jgi:ArsR family transcriptional regulator